MDFTNVLTLCYYAYLPFLLQILSRFQIDASSISRRVSSKREIDHCFLKCHYGHDTDVEGNAICRCYDPCANVFCLGGKKCVIYPRKHCLSGVCRPRAICKEVSQHPGNEVDKNVQSDSASNLGTTTASMLDVCSIPVRGDAYKCRRKRRRWYFDQVKGKCIKFKGCEGDGNNFSRKRLCKKQCIKKKDKKKGRRRRRHRGKGGRQASRTPKLEEFRASQVSSSRSFPPFNIEKILSAPGVYYTAACPPDKPIVQCTYNPCEKCRDFYVLCEINLCGSCGANYYHRQTGHRLDKCTVH